MREVGYIVRLYLPDTMSTEQGEKDLHNCISFGQPGIRLLYYIDNCIKPEETEQSMSKRNVTEVIPGLSGE